jgi:hypothetical protein
VSSRKAFLPSLWSDLKGGFGGNAAVIRPSLLPLLSKIPSDRVGCEREFYRQLLSNLVIG